MHIELEVEVGGVKSGGKMCPVSLSGTVSVLFTHEDIFSLPNQEDSELLKISHLMFSFNALKRVVRVFHFCNTFWLQIFLFQSSHMSKQTAI